MMHEPKSNSGKSEKPPEETIELDVRGLEPPEPIMAVLKKVTELPPKTNLRVRIDSNPWQLYDLLQQRGFFYESEKTAEGGYCGIVRRREHSTSH